MLDKPRYFLVRALRNMAGSPFLCSAAVLTMAVALTSVGVFFLVVLNLQALTANWQEDIQIIAFLDQPPAAAELQKSMDQIRGFAEIDEVRFVDSRQALERFRTRLGQDSDLLEGIEDGVLPPSFELTLKPAYRNRQAVQQVVDRLGREAGLNDLQYGKDWLEQFESFTNLVRLVRRGFYRLQHHQADPLCPAR
jgi:cell division transport system permease protein